jgi:hypothetical protein
MLVYQSSLMRPLPIVQGRLGLFRELDGAVPGSIARQHARQPANHYSGGVEDSTAPFDLHCLDYATNGED